ncbi:Cyclic di-GMP phosphodiesterase Gmr [Legionella massiliensis]|uniref:cyclic-guanylate-specific phosphodiesterase n=1 Tax=Legionella massiliensis TaxID=1034943 RepID=A0A078L2H8_9GAMM|nr:EAL domain-containing protein [Legionella massiliensis]CDZ78319.1 Cyclic di-GMP phosphodiesterase Gmr [Legionella massiliensis]CEE14057.1 Cyclic di-GMP phosphodiesterase Gmr [Legionella massiliensis]
MDEKNYDFRIIIIDDNVEIHRDFIKILTKPPPNELIELEQKLFNTPVIYVEDLILPRFKIDTVTQGKEGIELISKAMTEKEPYSLAFVDIRMPPGWDGIETIKKIWKIDPDIHVVICTAYSDYSWEETIKELGHNDNFLLLKKPFDHIAVRQLAYALTRKWKLMRESRIYTKSLEQAVEKRTEELKYQATHDTLTGLSNRALLYDRMQHAIASCIRHRFSFAVLFFDLDRFKLVNDSLGHATGDLLLSIMAQRLSSSVRSIDTLARIGGDEFVLIITELSDPEYVHIVANKLLNVIKEPLDISGHELNISTSMGVAVYPQDGRDAEELLKNADSAMYHAKKLGGDQFQFYSNEMNSKALEQLVLESELYQALARNELTLWYQPQFHTADCKLEAVEALIRWNHPKKGMLLPLDFIPLAEESGLIIPIGEWVLREACQQNKSWQDKGLPHIRMAVNVTSQQLMQPGFVETVKNILIETKLDAKYLELELSETAIVNETISHKVNELKVLGIEIALDDFGTGYSSLHHLRNLSLDRLKIDQSFIYNIQYNRNDEVIIHAIIAMARSLNLDVLAEGVETQKQLEFLKEHDCNQMQGFYFSKPVPSQEIAKLLANPLIVTRIVKQEQKEKS